MNTLFKADITALRTKAYAQCDEAIKAARMQQANMLEQINAAEQLFNAERMSEKAFRKILEEIREDLTK